MAIVHVVYKSSSAAPPAAAHAQYLARDGQYERRGGLELIESGNMPEFAQADPFAFWVAADAHERANGRAYTEIQVALPRELNEAERKELARAAVRELMGDRFAYTMAIHKPLAKDNIDQPHMHLMFSERAVTEETRDIEEGRFFKRNGAKKDPAWNDRNKPDEVREKWVVMMNAAMEKNGIEERMDARSYRERGRDDLEELKEPKLLGGDGREARELREHVDELRQKRAELPMPKLDQAAILQQIEREASRAIAEIERRRDEEVSTLDKLIEKARELVTEVKERAVAAASSFIDRLESFLGTRKQGSDVNPEIVQERDQGLWPPQDHTHLDKLLAELDHRLAMQEGMDAQLAQLDKRMDAEAQQEKERSNQQEMERVKSRSREKDQGHSL